MKTQTRLPLFPKETLMFNPIAGVFQKDSFVYYLHNGLPLFCHHIDDRMSYRYITANMIVTGMCTTSEISKVLDVSVRSLQMNAKYLREKGSQYFLNRVETRGKCYKYDETKFAAAQLMLDAGVSQYEISKRLNVSESSVRYHVKSGKLKKKK